MALVFARRLAIPLWAIAFFTVALTVPPPATLFLMLHTALSVTTDTQSTRLAAIELSGTRRGFESAR